MNLNMSLDDIRLNLSREADKLALIAAQMGREAGKQATQTGRDTGKQASHILKDASGNASVLARRFLSMGAQNVRGLSNVRLTTKKNETGPNMLPGVALAGGVGIGLALTYFLDREQGSRRRSAMRDRLSRWTNKGREQAAVQVTELRNRSIEAVHEARKMVGIPVEPVEQIERSEASLNGATPEEPVESAANAG